MTEPVYEPLAVAVRRKLHNASNHVKLVKPAFLKKEARGRPSTAPKYKARVGVVGETRWEISQRSMVDDNPRIPKAILAT